MNPAMRNIVFEELYAGLAEHALPVIECLLRRENVRVHVVGQASEQDALRRAYQAVDDPARFFLHDFDSFGWDFPVHALFSCVPGSPGPLFRDVDSPLDIPRIAMPHGLTDKYNKFPAHFIGNPLGYFNVLFASGEAMYSGSWMAYEKKHPEVHAALRHIKAGVPKTDRLFTEQNRRDEILCDLGLDPLRETVLYAPTYQAEASLEQHGEQILNVLGGMGMNVLVRLHHLSVDPAATSHQPRDWKGIMETMLRRYPNMRFVCGDSTPYFIAADLLVGDVSGACYEFIVQDKPVVFVDAPLFFKKHGRDGIAWWGRHAGVIVDDVAQLEKVVFSQLDKPELKQCARLALIGRLLYRRGDASGYIADTILKMVYGDEAYPTWGPRKELQRDRVMQEYIIQRLHALASAGSRLAVYGCGKHTDRLLALMRWAEARGVAMPKITLFLDDGAEACREYASHPVNVPAQADCSEVDAILLSSDYFQPQMVKRCRMLWGKRIELIDLYAPFPWHRPDSLKV
jgi:hypothetical protein